MAEGKRLPVRISLAFLLDLDEVFNYGLETFGRKQAANYENEILELIERLPTDYSGESEPPFWLKVSHPDLRV